MRLPPHSIEAERSVLGSLILNETAWDKIADIIVEEDFYRHDHRLIFHAIEALAEKNSPCDAVTVSERLENVGDLEETGGLPYLIELADQTPSTSNIVAYATIVRARSVLRQLISTCTNVADIAYRPEGREVAEILDTAESQMFAIADQTSRSKTGLTSVGSIMQLTKEKLEELGNNPAGLTGVSTGYKDLDTKTSGFQKSDLIIIAGRPSMGKTSFAMNIVENVALNQDLPVAMFSMEMPGEQLCMRMIASLSRIELNRVRSGQLSDADWARITSATNVLHQHSSIYIDETPAMSPTEVRARCRRLHREHNGLALVVIDYLQLMQTGNKTENRATEISEISRSLKALAKELTVPVIALSQLNRSLEQRPDKRPIMSDLRESGAIEQDADVIAFVYRDEVYNEDSPDKGTAEILIRKQRNGPTGSVRLTFNGMFTRFDNYTQDHYGLEDL
ncbi:replicative DNA helicase [Chromatiales bacterium (ex Bugula neritina AB1)]|nr:replicative DNA helicase [Chromatiales bacterium (ex Bugula neritina AB1)]